MRPSLPKFLLLISLLGTPGLGIDADPFLAMSRNTAPKSLDLVAVSVLEDAIQKLHPLTKRYQGTAQEWSIRIRLAESYRNKSALYPRVQTEGRNYNAEYKAAIASEIDQLNVLIAHCSQHRLCADSYLLRGTAWKSLENIPAAKADYIYVITHFAGEEGVEQGTLYLAELEMNEGEYVSALSHLNSLAKRPDLEIYPRVLDRISWSYLALGNFDKALEINVKNIKFVTSSEFKDNTTLHPEVLALNESIFLARAIEAKKPGFDGFMAARRIAEDLPEFLRPSAIRVFPSLITSKECAHSIDTFSKSIIQTQPEKKETWEVAKVALERAATHRSLPSLETNLNDLSFGVSKYPKLVGDITAALRKAEKSILSLLAEENGTLTADQQRQATRLLKEIYTIGVDYFQRNSLASAQYQFNLAALEFTDRNYAKSEDLFHTVWKSSTGNSDKAKALRQNALGQLVIVRYRRILAMMAPGSVVEGKVIPLTTKWDEWRAQAKPSSSDEMSVMCFTLAKSMYGSPQRQPSLVRLIQYLKEFPKSNLRQEAAKLLIAHYTEQKNWENLYEVASNLSKFQWPSTAFSNGLRLVQANAAVGIVQSQFDEKKYKTALDSVHQYEPLAIGLAPEAKLYNLAVASAMQLSEKEIALSYLEKEEAIAPSGKNRYRIALIRGSRLEDKFEFEQAVSEYSKFLGRLTPKDGVAPSDSAQLKNRMTMLATISGSSQTLKTVLTTPNFCRSSAPSVCVDLTSLNSFYQALESHGSGSNKTKIKGSSFEMASAKFIALDHRSPEALQKLGSWRVALEEAGVGQDKDDSLDSYRSFAVLTHTAPYIVETLRAERSRIRANFPKRFDPQALHARIRNIKHFEATIAQLKSVKIPEFQAACRNELAGSYEDWATDLDVLSDRLNKTDANSASAIGPVLAEMTAKFRNLASSTISTPKDRTPALAMPGLVPFAPDEIVSRMGLLAPQSGWKEESMQGSDKSSLLKKNIVHALSVQQFVRAKYLAAVGHHDGLLSDSEYSVVATMQGSLFESFFEGKGQSQGENR